MVNYACGFNQSETRKYFGERLTSWLFTKRGVVEFGAKTKPARGREEDLNPGPSDYESNALPLGHVRLPSVGIKKNRSGFTRS